MERGRLVAALAPKLAARPRGSCTRLRPDARAYGPLRGTPNATACAGDLWEWDGNDWAQVQTPTASPPRMRAPLVWDAARERVVLFGGLAESTSNDVHSETWVFGETATSAAWSYGAGCSGSNGVPTLDAFGTPVLGSSTFALEVLFAPPLAPVFVALSTAPDSVPVGYPFTGVNPLPDARMSVPV